MVLFFSTCDESNVDLVAKARSGIEHFVSADKMLPKIFFILKIFTFKLQNCKKLKFKIAKFVNKRNKNGKNKNEKSYLT